VGRGKMILKTEDLTFGFGDQILFKDVNIQIEKGDKIALLGPNGSGKTTLLKILREEMDGYSGEIVKKKNIKIGYQRQFRVTDPDRSLWKEFEKEFSETIELIEKSYEIEHEHLAFEKKIRSVLKGVGFEEDDWNRPLKTFSGGELTRISLGKLFLKDYDLLVLDEPTNHLDITSVYWLEEFLKSFQGTLLMVTHDRDLLNGVVNQVMEINAKKIWAFRMKYEDYLLQRQRLNETREKERKNLEKELDRQKKLVKQFETWLNMGSVKAISQMHSREKTVERLEEELGEIEEMEETQSHPGDLPQPDRTGYVVLEVNDLAQKIENHLIFNAIRFKIQRGEKVVRLGKNGVGKTTLFKTLAGEIKPASGYFQLGHKVNMAYLSQNLSNLNLNNDIFNELHELVPMKKDYEIRAYAGRFGFIGEDIFKTVDFLSGGEKLKLSLAKMMLKRPNLLLLDEPTNHLDIGSIEKLQGILKEYQGAVMMVTHDRRLLKEVSDKLLVLSRHNIETVRSVDQYVNKLKKDANLQKGNDKNSQNRLSYEEQKALKNRKQKLEREIESTEKRFYDLENEKKEIEKKLFSQTIADDYTKLSQYEKRKNEIDSELEDLIERLGSLEEERESFL